MSDLVVTLRRLVEDFAGNVVEALKSAPVGSFVELASALERSDRKLHPSGFARGGSRSRRKYKKPEVPRHLRGRSRPRPADIAIREERLNAVLAILARAGKPVGASEVRALLGVTRDQFLRAVDIGLETRRIVRTGQKAGVRYSLP
jgi:hypothetical protein